MSGIGDHIAAQTIGLNVRGTKSLVFSIGWVTVNDCRLNCLARTARRGPTFHNRSRSKQRDGSLLGRTNLQSHLQDYGAHPRNSCVHKWPRLALKHVTAFSPLQLVQMFEPMGNRPSAVHALYVNIRGRIRTRLKLVTGRR